MVCTENTQLISLRIFPLFQQVQKPNLFRRQLADWLKCCSGYSEGPWGVTYVSIALYAI